MDVTYFSVKNLANSPAFKSDILDWLLTKITNDPDGSRVVFEAISKLELWSDAVPKLLGQKEPLFDVSLAFQSRWLTSGHTIRDCICSDLQTSKLLRHMLPKYDGYDKVLYRGESKWNWDNGQIGFCWTDKFDVAETFAGGWHNGEHGAVVITGNFPASAIISGPELKQSHALKDAEREFTIDPFYDVLVVAVRCHGPYDETGNYKPDWPLPEETKRRCQR